MNFMIAAYSDVGIKKHTNQDALLIKTAQTNLGKVCLCVVCDGMGGLNIYFRKILSGALMPES